jgi:hypothetical protein
LTIRRPPLDRLSTWADAVGLRGDERQAFILLGNLYHASPMVQERIRDLEAEVGKLKDKKRRSGASSTRRS